MAHNHQLHGFQRHPNNHGAWVAITRPNPEDKQKVRQMENHVADLKNQVEQLTALVQKLATDKLGDNEGSGS